MLLIGLAARSVLAGVKRAREEAIERRKRLGIDTATPPVPRERVEAKDETVIAERPALGAWRRTKEGTG